MQVTSLIIDECYDLGRAEQDMGCFIGKSYERLVSWCIVSICIAT